VNESVKLNKCRRILLRLWQYIRRNDQEEELREGLFPDQDNSAIKKTWQVDKVSLRSNLPGFERPTVGAYSLI
jgi:hypothetical protein